MSLFINEYQSNSKLSMAAKKELDAPTRKVMYNKFAEARLNGIKIEMLEPEDPRKYVILFEPLKEDFVFGNHKYLLWFDAIKGTEMYPWNPPNISFLTPIFHTNVSSSGSICLNAFNQADKWTKGTGIDNVLTALRWLMRNPETGGSHLNGEATKLWNLCQNKIGDESKASEDELKRAFAPYIKVNDEIYSKKLSVMRQYAKYFPEILDFLPDDRNTKNWKQLTEDEKVFHTLISESSNAIVETFKDKIEAAKKPIKPAVESAPANAAAPAPKPKKKLWEKIDI